MESVFKVQAVRNGPDMGDRQQDKTVSTNTELPNPVVLTPGHGDQQGVLAFVTQHLMDQLQLTVNSPHLVSRV